MKKILINKQIGSDFFENGITADFVRDELNKAKLGEEIQLIIDSPGGYVWDCISIFNVIRDYCRNHSNPVNTYIQGIAMSCASVIALAAKTVNKSNKITVEDNSIYMIHNCWNVVVGNEHDFRKAAEDMAAIDNIIASAYKTVTGKTDKEIHQLMDAETYFYGKEIVDNFFADSVIEVETADGIGVDKTAALAHARNAWQQTKTIMEKAKDIAGQKIAAMATQLKTDAKNSAPEKNKNAGTLAGREKTEAEMTAEEFRAAHPEEANKIFAEGVAAERKRCAAHLKMGETANALDVAASFIRDGKPATDEEVATTYFEARVKNAAKTDRAQDDVPSIQTPAENKDAGMAEALAAFDKRIGGAR